MLVEFDPELKRTWEDEVFGYKIRDKRINSNDKFFQGGDWGGWRKPTGVHPRAKVYYAKIAEFYFTNRDNECIEAFDAMLYDFMLPRNEIPEGAYRLMLHIFNEKGLYTRAKEECYEPLRQKFSLKMEDLIQLMRVYLGRGEYDLVDDVFEAYQVLGYTPDSTSFCMKFLQVYKVKGLDAAEDYLHNVIEKTEFINPLESYVELIKLAYKEGRLDKCDALEAKFFANEEWLVSDFYDYYFTRLADAKALETIKETFNTLARKSILMITKNIAKHTIETYCTLDDPEGLMDEVFFPLTANNLFNTPDLWAPIIAKRFDWAENLRISHWIWRALNFKEFPLNTNNYLKVMYMLMENATYIQLQGNLSMLRENRIPMTPQAIYTAVKSLVGQEDFIGAKQIFVQEVYGGDAVQPTTETMELLLEFGQKTGQDVSFVTERPDLSEFEYIPAPTQTTMQSLKV